MKDRLATVLIERSRTVAAVVVGIALAAGLWGVGVISELSLGGYDDPASESARVEELLESEFGRSVADVVVIYTPTGGRTVDDIGTDVTAGLDSIDPALLIRDPITYWSVPAPFADGLRSADGASAIAVLTLRGDEDRRIKGFQQIRHHTPIEGVDVEYGGFAAVVDAYNEQARSDLIRAELITFPILLVLLLLIFGGVVSAAMPLLIGGLSILGSLAALRVLGMFTEVSVFAVNIASLVGLGMAVDYSLFVLTRFREELRGGASTPAALRRTMATAGRTVTFSALLLVCGFVGMLVFPQAMIRSLGFGGMAAVAVAAVVSLTALPAVLALLGPRVDALTWRAGAIDRGEARARRFWGAVAERVMRAPAIVTAAIIALLALLSSPITGLALGELDHTGLPASSSARIATDRLLDDFPLTDSAVSVVVRSDTGRPPSAQTLGSITSSLERVDGVTAVTVTGTGGDFTALAAVMSAPDRTTDAFAVVERIRAVDTPAGATLELGGATASTADGLDSVHRTIPWMLAIMIGATFVLTTVAFRSIVLSIKAIAMAIVSLGATFGILTWVFVDGHGSSVLGITPGPLHATMSILIIAVVFGLSTDYEVFLLSRMVEARDGGASTREAVRIGAARTGRIVTAAALLLITVTAFFSLSELAMMRLVGIGIIVGLVIDATIVRMLLVPALVALMGEANWWLRTPPRRDRPVARPPTVVGGAGGRSYE